MPIFILPVMFFQDQSDKILRVDLKRYETNFGLELSVLRKNFTSMQEVQLVAMAILFSVDV